MNLKFEYSKELDIELNLVLQEYRDGKITVSQMLKLVDMACREHLESTNGKLGNCKNPE